MKYEMNSDFAVRMKAAKEKGIEEYRKELIKELADYERNKKYITLYTDLVLKIVETFEYGWKNFNMNKIDKLDISEAVGNPFWIHSKIDREKKLATITFEYKEVSGKKTGRPSFIDNKEIDFYIVNEVLSENEIKVSQPDQNLAITFNISSLLEMSDVLSEERKTEIKRILSRKQ